MMTSTRSLSVRSIIAVAMAVGLSCLLSSHAVAQATQEKSGEQMRARIERLETSLKAIEFLLKYDLKGQYERIQKLQGRIGDLDKKLQSIDAGRERSQKEHERAVERLQRSQVVRTEELDRTIDAMRREYQASAEAQDALRKFYVDEKRTLRLLLVARQREWKESVARYPDMAAKIAASLDRTAIEKAARRDADEKASRGKGKDESTEKPQTPDK